MGALPTPTAAEIAPPQRMRWPVPAMATTWAFTLTASNPLPPRAATTASATSRVLRRVWSDIGRCRRDVAQGSRPAAFRPGILHLMAPTSRHSEGRELAAAVVAGTAAAVAAAVAGELSLWRTGLVTLLASVSGWAAARLLDERVRRSSHAVIAALCDCCRWRSHDGRRSTLRARWCRVLRRRM